LTGVLRETGETEVGQRSGSIYENVCSRAELVAGGVERLPGGVDARMRGCAPPEFGAIDFNHPKAYDE
jgi:hypothetical protein